MSAQFFFLNSLLLCSSVSSLQMLIKRPHYCKGTYFVIHESKNFGKFKIAPYGILKNSYFLCFSFKDLEIFTKVKIAPYYYFLKVT